MANWQRVYWVVGMLVLDMGNIRVVQIETSGRASAQTRANPVDAIAQSPLSYRIDTLAGNGQPGDTPGSVKNARKVPVDLPFGVEQGPDNAIYITTVGSHRVLRYDPRSAQITRVAGNGRAGYAGDGGQATEAMLRAGYAGMGTSALMSHSSVELEDDDGADAGAERDRESCRASRWIRWMIRWFEFSYLDR